ncbi:bacterio-opsin activator domain-containing protein [Halegenticoccus soli]|uniref:bacterio-opsin activator domain-containing protein n=1 Tax=Halegenticoccus soli TaxID=1985678 RepID=UPI000C6E1C83|nr:bacterio-opsin activator domain-containing protein [Halegenticoccus soli]
MADPVRLLYVTPNDDHFARTKAVFDEEYPELSVTRRSDGASARALLSREPVDCVVGATELPDETAPRLFAAVREGGDDVPLIAVAERGADAPAREIYDAGADGYVQRAETERAHALAGQIRASVERARGRNAEPSDGYLRALTETMSDAIVTVDESGTIRYANAALEETLGYGPEELVGRPLTALIPAVSRSRHDAAFRRYLSSGERRLNWENVAVTGVRKDGTEVPLSVSFSEFAHEGRRYVTGVVRDVSERERLRSELDGVLERVTDAFFALDAEWRFTYVNERAEELIDGTEAELLGNLVWDMYPEAVGTAFQREYERAMETQEAVAFEEYYPPLDAWFRVHAYPSETGLSVYFRDVTARKHREEKLAALTDTMRALLDAQTRGEVCEVAAEAAREKLDLPNSRVELYDEETGLLRPVTDDGRRRAALRDERGDDVAWQVFVEGEPRVYTDLRVPEGGDRSGDKRAVYRAERVHEAGEGDGNGETGGGNEDRPSGAALVPLGRHGVFVTTAKGTGTYSETDASLAEILAAGVRAALDQADREDTLRERTAALEEKNEALERLQRVNGVIREIAQVLTQASTREEIEQAVCDRLASVEPYRFAWIGVHDTVTDEIVPRAFGGVERGYLKAITMTADERLAGGGPSGRAIRTHDPQVQNNIHSDPPFEPWREEALKRGYRSSIAVPLVYGETRYGVLNLYAGRPNAFNPMEETVLAELGETIGHALNALERKRALVSNRSVELEFRVADPIDQPLALVDELGGEFAFEHLLQRSDDRLHLFFVVRGGATEALSDRAARAVGVDRLTKVAERDGESLFECTLSEPTVFASLLDRGAVPRRVDLDENEGRAVVRVPQRAEVRSFVDVFRQHFGTAELVARRERDDPVRTAQEFATEFDARLTERQEEVLRTAYFAGFFEWPRESTGQDVAAMLDVSQPTVHRHIRAGERKLFSLLFDGEPVSER